MGSEPSMSYGALRSNELLNAILRAACCNQALAILVSASMKVKVEMFSVTGTKQTKLYLLVTHGLQCLSV